MVNQKKGARIAGKKPYSLSETYSFAVKAFRMIKEIKRGKKAGVFDKKYQEKIMLAVTSVNDCPMCSYAHTEMALKAGLSNDEIVAFLADDFKDLPVEQTKAILFAQHYADVRGKLDKKSWDEIVNEYGIVLAESILAATRIVMMGNAIGIVLSSIQGRWSGKREPRCGVFHEIAFVVAILPIILFAMLQSLLMNLFKMPLVNFAKPPKNADVQKSGGDSAGANLDNATQSDNSNR